MARGIELATAYVTLAVTSNDIASEIAKQFGHIENRVAPQSGAKIGKAMSKGFDSNKPDLGKLEADFERSKQKIVTAEARATKEQENLARKVEIAEAKKKEAVAKYGEESSQALVAVDRLKLAEQKLEAANLKTESSFNKLWDELGDTEKALLEAKGGADGLETTLSGIGDASDDAKLGFGKLGDSTDSLGDAGEGASKKWGKLGDAIGSAIKGDFSGAFASLKPSAESAAGGVEGVLGGMGKSSSGKFGSKFVAGLGALGGLVAAAGIGKAVADAITDGMDSEKTAKLVQASLGLSEEDADRYSDVVASIYSTGLGESRDQAAEAVDALLSSFPKLKVDSTQLDDASQKLLALNEAFAVDLPQAAQSAAQLVENGAAKNMSEAFDLMAAGMQKVPKSLRDEYTDAIEEYIPHLTNLGYTGKEVFGILASSTEMGKYGIDKAGDALKEFSIRSTDMSKSSVKAYDLMGLSAQDMSNKLLAGGDDAREATGQIVDGLLSIKDPTDQANAAIALFGTPLEDLGVKNIPKFLEGLDKSGDALGDVKGKAEEVSDTMKGGASEGVERFKRGFDNLKQSVGSGLLDGLYAVSDWAGNTFGPVFSQAGDTISSVWENTIKPALDSLWGFIKDTLSPVFKALWEDAVKPTWESIQYAIGIAWDTIKPIFKGIWSFIRDTLGPTFVWLWDNIVKPVWGFIKGAIKVAWNVIKPIFKIMNGFMREVIGPTFLWLRDSIIKPVWNFIGDKISTVWHKGIKPIFKALRTWAREKIGPAFEAAKDGVKNAWNKIRDAVKKPVNFVINTVWNKGIVGLFNKAAKHLPGAPQLKEFHPKGFWSGGWTGAGERLQPAGIVHADEFVIRKSSRKKIEDEHPGLLDRMNATGMVGYSDGGRVLYPTSQRSISSGFGTARGGGAHAGVDFPVPIGTAVRAALTGKVIRAAWNAVAGRTGMGMLLEHPGNRNTYYGHLSGFVAGVGDFVDRGQIIAKSGNTGRSTGPHLHFETWSGGQPKNPMIYLAGAELESAMKGFTGGWGQSSPADQLPGLLKPFQDLRKKLGEIGSSDWGKVAKAAGKKLINMPIEWIKEHVGDLVPVRKLGMSSAIDSVVKQSVQGVAEKYGWGSGPQWDAIDWIVQHESSWNPAAKNPTSSATGLFQQMASIHGPVSRTPAGQAEWGLNYIKSRYGSPTAAKAFWQAHNWYADGGRVAPALYDTGGWLQPGDTITRNLTRKPEAVLTSEQWRIVEKKVTEKESALGSKIIVQIGEREFEGYAAEIADGRVIAGINTYAGR